MTLQIRDNCCTDQIKIHPICGKVYYIGGKDSSEGVHIYFDKRQVWSAYYYRFADAQGWVLSRGIMQVTLPNKEFERIFGEYEILGRVN